jgi:hypothetical protein
MDTNSISTPQREISSKEPTSTIEQNTTLPESNNQTTPTTLVLSATEEKRLREAQEKQKILEEKRRKKEEKRIHVYIYNEKLYWRLCGNSVAADHGSTATELPQNLQYNSQLLSIYIIISLLNYKDREKGDEVPSIQSSPQQPASTPKEPQQQTWGGSLMLFGVGMMGVMVGLAALNGNK